MTKRIKKRKAGVPAPTEGRPGQLRYKLACDVCGEYPMFSYIRRIGATRKYKSEAYCEKHWKELHPAPKKRRAARKR